MLNGNGPMPEILYFNGRRVALGDDLEPVVLFDKAQPGDKVTVAVKLLHTVDTKTFRGVTLRIDFRRRPAQSRRSAPGVPRRRLLVPSLAPGDASRRSNPRTAPSPPSISPPSTQTTKPRSTASLKNARNEARSAPPAARSRPPSTSTATPISMPPGSGPGPKPSTSSSAPSPPRCS